MWFVMKFFNSVDFSVKNRFEILPWNREDYINVLQFQFALRHVNLILSFHSFVFQLLNFFLWSKVSNHFTQISEERSWMIVRISFFIGNLGLLILLLLVTFCLLGLRLFLQIPDMESLKNRGKKSFDLSNERSDRFCFGIKENDASKIFQEFDERFMEDFAGFLIITASVLLCELSFEKFDKLRLQQDFMQGDEDFNDHEHNLTQGIDKPDTVLDFELFSEHFGSV